MPDLTAIWPEGECVARDIAHRYPMTVSAARALVCRTGYPVRRHRHLWPLAGADLRCLQSGLHERAVLLAEVSRLELMRWGVDPDGE